MSIIEEIESHLNHYRSKTTAMEIKSHDADTKDPEQLFKRSWNKLSGQEKINRLMNYHRIMVGNYSLSKESSNGLQKLFFQNYESLSDSIVEYDVESAKVINIKGLKKDGRNDEFYLENFDRPAGIKVKAPTFNLNLKPIQSPISNTSGGSESQVTLETNGPQEVPVRSKTKIVVVKKRSH